MSLITISESVGSGAMAVAESVGRELTLEIYDDKRLEKEALRMGIQAETLEELDEKAPGLFGRIWSKRPQMYLDLMQSVVYEVAKTGQGIILGHASQVLLRDFGCALHIRMYASDSIRIDHLIKQQGLSREAAEKVIHKSDNEQRGFLQFAYQMDWDDPSLYDLVINRDKLSIDLAVQLIIEAARSHEIKECSLTALETMEKLSLARRVEAALLEKRLGRELFHIEVPVKGVVHITGITDGKETEKHVLKIVKAIPGVTDVKSELAVVPMGYD
jgi:cytidylate kinase